MRKGRRAGTLAVAVAAAAAALAAAAGVARADPSAVLTAGAAGARVWTDGRFNVVELTGPGASVVVDQPETGRATLSADAIVVWISPEPGGPADARQVEVALLGHARISQDGRDRTQGELWVPTTPVHGSVTLVGERANGPDTDSQTYARAVALRRAEMPVPSTTATAPAATTTTTTPTTATTTETAAATVPSVPLRQRPAVPGGVVELPPAVPADAPKQGPLPGRSVSVDRADFDRTYAADGTLAAVLSGGVTVRYRDEKRDLTEFVAQQAVLFTDLKDADLKALGGAGGTGGAGGRNPVMDHVVSAYFEGDVRVYVTPAAASRNELRLRAARVYYEFATDRAVLTEVVLHTVDAQKGIPIFIRADALRQKSQTEFSADGARFASSAFATPTYDLRAGHAEVQTEDTGDPRLGERVSYQARDVTLDAFGLPVFYLPVAAGTMTARGGAFRGIEPVLSSSQFGPGVRTKWGLFESLGLPPPEELDASYDLDYHGKRGAEVALDGVYAGGGATELTKQPTAFAGDFHVDVVPDDIGTDVLGSSRRNETPADKFRGRAVSEKTFDLTRGWQVQARLGYDSDSNFLPEWKPGEYENALPVDESIYLVNRDGSGFATALAEFQPNRVVTTADAEQANREISRLPELQYDRVGDSLLGDRLTFYSENSAAGLKYVRNEQSLAQQGFYPGVEPGIPGYAYNGDPGQTTYRGDSRQEVDLPFDLGPVKVVPYAFGRYTVYNQGNDTYLRPNSAKAVPAAVAVGPDQNRLLVGAGAKVSTDFWKTDDAAESDLFDVHRLRHVVSPSVNLFASAQTVDQSRVFVYDQDVDAANDVQAMQIDLLQRWQTKRGGPGRWRSVDVLTLDLYANLFANQPTQRIRDPADFRSVFFDTRPETSIPRNTANADATWRISDTTAVLANYSQNLDYDRVAFAAIGVAVQRDARLSYYLGTRYIAALGSDYANFEVNYELDRKYTLAASEGIDLAQSRNINYAVSLLRKFDNFQAGINLFYNEATGDKGVSVTFQPFGLSRGVGSGQLTQPQQ